MGGTRVQIKPRHCSYRCSNLAIETANSHSLILFATISYMLLLLFLWGKGSIVVLMLTQFDLTTSYKL